MRKFPENPNFSLKTKIYFARRLRGPVFTDTGDFPKFSKTGEFLADSVPTSGILLIVFKTDVICMYYRPSHKQ